MMVEFVGVFRGTCVLLLAFLAAPDDRDRLHFREKLENTITPVPAGTRGVDAPAWEKEESKKKTTRKKKESSSSGWRLPTGGYAKKLRTSNVKSVKRDGLRVNVACIPDAYIYEMALGMEEFEKQGLMGEKLGSKLKALHQKHKRSRKKMLFVVQLAPTDKQIHVFLGPKLKEQLRLTAKVKKTFTIAGVDPRPKIKVWDVYEYPPNQPRRFNRRPMIHLTEPLTLTLASRAVKKGSTEPIVLSLGGAARQRKRPAPNDSINLNVRQISCVEWSSLAFKDMNFTFYPARWKRPKPPEGFTRLIRRLDGSR